MSASPKDGAAAAAHDLNGGAVQVAYDLLSVLGDEARASATVIWEGKLGHFRCYVTDEEYLARVTPYLDNEGRARVQEALSERLTKGGIAVPPGGDS